MKRSLDLFICIIFIILLLIPILLICTIIKIDSKGPVLNITNRIGKNKRVFKMFKFRTMKVETPLLQTEDLQNPDKFITNFGKVLRIYSLDEIPQIINILRGDMSFVGPRPSLDIQFDLIKKRDDYKIHDIKPGITGLAQVNGRDSLEISEKVALDAHYKNNQSVYLDMKIILKTFLVVVRSKDIKH